VLFFSEAQQVDVSQSARAMGLYLLRFPVVARILPNLKVAYAEGWHTLLSSRIVKSFDMRSGPHINQRGMFHGT